MPIILGRSTSTLPLHSFDPSPLLQQCLPSLREHSILSALYTLQPVAEGSADRCVDWVGPEGAPGEEGAHFDSKGP